LNLTKRIFHHQPLFFLPSVEHTHKMHAVAKSSNTDKFIICNSNF